MADQRIDFSRYTGGSDSEGVSRQQNPQREIRPQAEKERAPDYHQRSVEKKAARNGQGHGLEEGRGKRIWTTHRLQNGEATATR